MFVCSAGCKLALPRDERSALGLTQPHLLLQLQIGTVGRGRVGVGGSKGGLAWVPDHCLQAGAQLTTPSMASGTIVAPSLGQQGMLRGCQAGCVLLASLVVTVPSHGWPHAPGWPQKSQRSVARYCSSLCTVSLVLQGGPFSLELGWTDAGGTRRRILLSSSFSELKTTLLHCQVGQGRERGRGRAWAWRDCEVTLTVKH